MRRIGSYPTLALLLVIATVVVNVSRRDGQSHYRATQRYEDIYYLPPPDWLKVFSLGHREAVADLIWLRALVYFGEELQQRGDVLNLYNYTDAMLALDPRFKKVYSWVATNAIYRTGNVEVDDVQRALAYLERGVRLFPDDGELAWTLGATYMYELTQLLPAEQRPEARRRGLEHLRVAARLGAGPPWIVLSTATELGRLGQTEQLIAHLEETYDQVNDPAVKAEIEARLARLRSASFSEALRRTYEEIEAARRRDFPYVDRDLYLLLGPRPPFDGTALLARGFDPEPDLFADTADDEAASSAGQP